MKIFELLQSQPDPQNQDQVDPRSPQNQKPQNPEDDSQGKFDADKVGNNLQDMAQGIDDQNAQPELPDGAQGEAPELDNQETKPLDDALLSQVKGLPYTTKYDYDDNSPLNPLKIAGMQLQDLSSLKDQVRFKMQQTMMKNQVGLDDDPMIEYCADLLKFINTVMGFKKSNTSAQLSKYRSAPSYQTQQRSASQSPPK